MKVYSKVRGKRYKKNEPSKSEMISLLRLVEIEIIEFWMDDGLIMLPNAIDRIIGLKTYRMIERMVNTFGENPFSNIMLVVGRKNTQKD